MPSRLRLEAADAVHHAYGHAVDGEQLFRSDRDRHRYLARLGEVAHNQRWHCLAYCLMGNHHHLIIQTDKPNLGNGFLALNTTYARYYNDTHGRRGHLFWSPYEAKLIRSDAQLFMTAAYTVLNPVRAGLVRAAADYRWSSHGAIASGAAPAWLASARLFEIFGAMAGGDGAALFAAFVDGR